MRKKLEASQSVLEGLALEDFDLIARGAKHLKTTSAAAEFLVIHDPLYTEQADEFRRIIDKLERAAKEKRIDGATLAYVDMTMSCVECHKYVRNVLVAQ
jgi:predicted GTPase